MVEWSSPIWPLLGTQSLYTGRWVSRTFLLLLHLDMLTPFNGANTYLYATVLLALVLFAAFLVDVRFCRRNKGFCYTLVGCKKAAQVQDCDCTRQTQEAWNEVHNWWSQRLAHYIELYKETGKMWSHGKFKFSAVLKNLALNAAEAFKKHYLVSQFKYISSNRQTELFIETSIIISV